MGNVAATQVCKSLVEWFVSITPTLVRMRQEASWGLLAKHSNYKEDARSSERPCPKH